MAGKAPQSCDCPWLRALCEKLERDLERVELEKNHLKDLLWKSAGSWAEKERAIEDDIIMASEEGVNEQENGESDN